MPAFHRRRGCLLGVLGLLVAAVAAAALALWWLLDAGTLSNLAETRLSEALGRPVTIGRVSVGLFPPAVEGSDVRVAGAETGSRAAVTLRTVRLRPRLSSLFSSPVVIERLEMIGLALDVVRSQDGRWILPLPMPGAGAEARSRAAESGVRIDEIWLREGRLTVINEAQAQAARRATVSDIDARVRSAGQATTLDSLTARVGRSRLEGEGRIDAGGAAFSLAWTSLVPEDLPEVFALLGTGAPEGLSIEGERPLTLDLRVGADGSVTARGRVAASRASLGTITLTGLEAPLRFADRRLVLDPLSFAAYGGTHRGRFTLDTAATPAAWRLESRLENVDVERLVSENTAAGAAVAGTGHLEARLAGRAVDDPLSTVEGTLDTRVANGVIRNFPILAAVGDALKLGTGDERDLSFDHLSATWEVASRRATTKDFVAESGELALHAQGTLGFDRSLDFQARLIFSREKSDELIRRVHEMRALADDEGRIEVPLAIQGTVAAPAFRIDAAALLREATQEELKRRLKKGLERIIK